MKSPVFKAWILALVLYACQEPEKQQPAQESPQEKKEEKQEPEAYIPVNDYIRSEIKAVDSTPTGILEIYSFFPDTHRNGGKKGKGFIKPEQFNKLAQDFLIPELEKGRFERSFKESSFMDRSTESVVFNYESTDSTNSVRRVDVLIATSLSLDKIKSIYIEKAYLSGDTTVQQKMSWKTGESFTIITFKSVGGKGPDRHETKVVWDPFHYEDQ